MSSANPDAAELSRLLESEKIAHRKAQLQLTASNNKHDLLVAKLRENIRDLDEENTSLKFRNTTDLTQSIQQLSSDFLAKSLQKTILRLEAELEKKNREIRDLEAEHLYEIDRKHDRISELCQENMHLEEDLKTVEDRLDRTLDEVDKLIRESMEAKDELERVYVDFDKSEETIDRLNDTIAALEAQLSENAEEPILVEEPVWVEEPILAKKPFRVEEPILMEEAVWVDKFICEEWPVLAQEPILAQKPSLVKEPTRAKEPKGAQKTKEAYKPKEAQKYISICWHEI